MKEEEQRQKQQEQARSWASSFWEERRSLYGIYGSETVMHDEMERYGVIQVQPHQTILTTAGTEVIPSVTEDDKESSKKRRRMDPSCTPVEKRNGGTPLKISTTLIH